MRAVGRSPAFWSILGVVVFTTVWEIWVRAADVAPYITIEPSRIARTLADSPGFFVDQTWTTAWHTLVGVGAALGAALAVGAVLASVRQLEWAVQPILVVIMVTPWVAYITSVVGWLGSGTPTILFMVAFVTFPPFVFAAVLGLRSADVAAVELLSSVDARHHEVFWRLRLPSALPSLFTAGRFTVGLGLATAYFAEGGSSAPPGSGLGESGRRVTLSSTGYPILWGSIVCAAALGVTFLVGVIALERRVLSWHASQRIAIG
jgi:NitT/TauT family transport system permease protein